MSVGAERAVTVTRADLYEQVWSKPVRSLARDYGDVGLGKVCQRLDVPRPGLRYWTRLRPGHTPGRHPGDLIHLDMRNLGRCQH